MAKKAHTALAVDEVKRSQERRVRKQRTQLVDSFLDFSQVYRSAPASGGGRGLTTVLVDSAHDGLHDVSQVRGGGRHRTLACFGNPLTRSESFWKVAIKRWHLVTISSSLLKHTRNFASQSSGQ